MNLDVDDSIDKIQNQLSGITQDIEIGIYKYDEDIKKDLEEQLNNFDEDRRVQFIRSLHQKFKGKSFLNLQYFKMIEITDDLHYQPQENLVNVYKALQNKNFDQILLSIQSPNFCEINQIPLAITKNQEILKQLGQNVGLIFDLIESQKYPIQYSNIKILELLLRIFYLNDEIHQFVGSCLQIQLYEFQYYIDNFKEKHQEGYEQLKKSLQIVQIKEKNIQEERQILYQNSKNVYLIHLFDLLSINIIEDQQKILLELLKNYRNIQNNDKNVNEIIKFFYRTENFNLLVDFVYFKLVIYFWIKYSEKFQLQKTFKELYENQLLKTSRKKACMDRFFKEYKQTQKQQDLIYQNLIYKIVFFSQIEDNIFIENYNQYQQRLNQVIRKQFKFETIKTHLNQVQNYYLFQTWKEIGQLKYYQLEQLFGYHHSEISFFKFVSTTPYSEEMIEKLNLILYYQNNLFETKKTIFKSVNLPSLYQEILQENLLNLKYMLRYQNVDTQKNPIMTISKWISQINLLDKYPQKLDFKLEEFNLILTQENSEISKQIIIEWLNNRKNNSKFRNLLPFYFNIIKRGEPSSYFLDLVDQGRKQLGCKEIDSLNMKSLFQLLYNNSDQELQAILIKLHSRNYPVPLIYKNTQIQNATQDLDLFRLNDNIYYLLEQDFTIINLSLSKHLGKIGKTHLINKIFYKDDKFEICDSSLINTNTIDCTFDFVFNGSRNFFIADAHGQFQDDLLKIILPFFKLWIIQMKSEQELIENVDRVNSILSSVDCKPMICFIIRDSQKEQIQFDLVNQIKATKVKICQLENLQQMDNQPQQGEITKIRNTLLEMIGKENEYVKEQELKNEFLQVFQKFGLTPIKLIKIQNIIDELEQELNIIKSEPEGFYNEKAFPLRFLDWKLQSLKVQKSECDLQIKLDQQNLEKKERLIYELEKQHSKCETNENDLKININDKLQQKDNINNNLKQLKEQQDQIIEQIQKFSELRKKLQVKQSKLLQIFNSLFKLDNFYIGYLKAVEKIAKFNSTLQIENEIQIKNEQENNIFKGKEDKTLQKNQELKNVSIELFWREIINGYPHFDQNYLEIIVKLIQKGEPFEFLNGDDLCINFEFLKQSGEKLIRNKESNKMLILSILGPQSSGKSTLLNKMFGCQFLASVGRCTKGMYLQLLKISNKEQFDNLYDYVLLLDSEGLQNPNQQDKVFDKRLALFIVSISDIIILNVKGEINSEFHNLIEMCLFTLGKHQKLSSNKQFNWCFNQNSQTSDKKKLFKQIEDIIDKLSKQSKLKKEYFQISGFREDDIEILGMASVPDKWNNLSCLTQSKEWNQERIIEVYAKDAYSIGIKAILQYISNCKTSLKEVQQFLSWEYFTMRVEECWSIVSRLPDVVEFAELQQQQDYERLNKILNQILRNKNIQFSEQVSSLTYQIQLQIKKYGKASPKNLQSIKISLEDDFQANTKQIQEEILQELSQQSQNLSISKRIVEKVKNHVLELISSHMREGGLVIQQEISKQKRQLEFQIVQDKVYKAVSQILEDQGQLNLYKNDKERREIYFNQIWMDIKVESTDQIEQIYDQFQEQLFSTICQFSQHYVYNFDNSKDYFEFYRTKVNKTHPSKEKLLENLCYEIFLSEFQQQSFICLYKESPPEYVNIFYQKINSKFENIPQNCIIDPKQFIEINTNQYLIEKAKFINHLQKNFKNFIQKVQLITDNNEFGEIIVNFIIFINQLQIDYDLKLFQSLQNLLDPNQNNSININRGQVFELLKNIVLTFKLCSVNTPCQYLQKSNLKFLQIYFPNYIEQVETTQNQLQENLKNYIIISEECVYKNKLHCHSKYYNYIEFIISQDTKLIDDQTFRQDFPTEFNKIMNETEGWDKLCQSIYDLTKKEIESQSKNIKSAIASSMCKEEDMTQINFSLISRIMRKVENLLKQFNIQFAFFGISISYLLERKLYHYSIFLIWRFICYNKWEILKSGQKQQIFNYRYQKNLLNLIMFILNFQNNKIILEQFINTSLTKYDQEKKKIQEKQIEMKSLFDDEICQKKKEASIRSGKTFAKLIQSHLIDQQYSEIQQKTQQYINKKYRTSLAVIQKLDQKLLIKMHKIDQFNQDFNEQIMLYVYQQKQFIELYKLYEQIQNHRNNKDLKLLDYFCDKNLDQESQEKYIFQAIVNFILGEQAENLHYFVQPDIFDNCNEEKFDIPRIKSLIINSTNHPVYQVNQFLESFLIEITTLKDQRIEPSIEKFNVQNMLDNLQNNMIGCDQSCPMCNRKCDSDDFRNKDHKHKCQNGHQLRGMNRILINSYPSLYTCEEIIDEAEIKIFETNIVKRWNEVKQFYQNWSFKELLSQERVDENKEKMMNIWNGGVGQLICKQLSRQFKQDILYLKKYDIPMNQQNHSTHYIFILDDSDSMRQSWQQVKSCIEEQFKHIKEKKFAKVSVIIFGFNAKIVINCQDVNIDKQMQLIQQEGSKFTSFDPALKLARELVSQHSEFAQTMILFYTDGQESWCSRVQQESWCPRFQQDDEVKKFCNIEKRLRDSIYFLACSQPIISTSLQRIVDSFNQSFAQAQLRDRIEPFQLNDVWTEIISKNYHKYLA